MKYEDYKDKIVREFSSWEKSDATYKGYLNNLNNGRNVWLNANRAVERAGEKMSSLLREVANSDIAYEDLRRLTAEEYRFLFNHSSNIGAIAQRLTNEAADIHMTVKFPKIDDSRIDGLLEILTRDHDNNILLSLSEVYNDGIGYNIAQDSINELIGYNSRIQNKAGFNTYMIRRTDGHCCEWCDKVADGVAYRKGEEPDDFWRFHDNCTCWIEYKVDKRIDIVSYKTRNGKMTKA